MEHLEELLSRLKDVDGRIDALLNNDNLTADQRGEIATLEADHDRLATAVTTERRRVEREAERKALEAEVEEQRKLDAERAEIAAKRKRLADERASRLVSTPSNRFTDFDRPTVNGAVDGGAGNNAAVWTIPATAKRFGRLQNFRGTKNGMEPEQRAYRFGSWMLHRLSQDMPNRFRFTDASEFVRRNMGAVTTTDGSGYHFIIPEEFGVDLIDLRETYGIARQLLKMVPMDSDTRTDPRRQSGLTAYFTAEGAAGTESSKAWNDVRLTAKDLMVISRYTSQVSADSVISVGDDLAGEISYAFATKEDQCAFNGDGTSTYGGIMGIRNRLRDIDGAGTDSAGLVTQATSNTWASMTLADFNTTVGKLPQFADQAGNSDCSWVCSKAFYNTVMLRLELAAGGNTVMEIANTGRNPRPLFMNYPVTFSQVFPIVTATTGVMATLGNYRMGASFGDRQQDKIDFSEHATIGGENVFERNQIAIRGTERFDINIHDVGDATNPGPIVGLQTG